jgi:phage terminase large subunit-like protein
MEEGAKMNPIGMGFVSQSAPTKYLEGLVLEKKINHGGHPVLSWMMSNVTIQEDPASNIKIHKGKSKDKIDGIAALIMALAEYMNTLEDGGESIYEDRGILFL